MTTKTSALLPHISMREDTVMVEIPKHLLEGLIHGYQEAPPVDWDAAERLYGAWRGKGIDGLAYERKLRES